jgi:hypothetical protein
MFLRNVCLSLQWPYSRAWGSEMQGGTHEVCYPWDCMLQQMYEARNSLPTELRFITASSARTLVGDSPHHYPNPSANRRRSRKQRKIMTHENWTTNENKISFVVVGIDISLFPLPHIIFYFMSGQVLNAEMRRRPDARTYWGVSCSNWSPSVRYLWRQFSLGDMVIGSAWLLKSRTFSSFCTALPTNETLGPSLQVNIW